MLWWPCTLYRCDITITVILSLNITWISNYVIDVSFVSTFEARSIQFMVMGWVCRRCWKVWTVKVEHFVILRRKKKCSRWEMIYWHALSNQRKNLYRMHICYGKHSSIPPSFVVVYLCATIIPRTQNKSLTLRRNIKRKSIFHIFLSLSRPHLSFECR